MAVAESCTGGLLSSRITDIRGSSDYFVGSIVSYSNETKTNVLNVNPETIEKYGAVSEQTALEMAVNVKNILKSDIGISITGIAGPDGGCEEKPVGLVYIGYSDSKQTFAVRNQFPGKRERIKIWAATVSMEICRKVLLGID